MSTTELKSTLLTLIDSINDSKTLNAIYTLLSKNKTEKSDWWDELTQEQKAGIESGLKDIKAGRVNSHEDVMKRVKSKFNLK